MVHEEVIEGIISDSAEKKENDPQSFSQWIIEHKKYFLFLFSITPIVITTIWKLIKDEDKGLSIFKDPLLVNNLICITAAIQCIFILFAVFLPVKEKRFLVRSQKKDKNSEVAKKNNTSENKKNKDKLTNEGIEEIANKALVQFKNAWTFVWASWFLLYATLLIRYLPNWYASLPSFSVSSPIYFYTWLVSYLSWFENIIQYDKINQFFLNLFNNCATVAFIICYIIFSEITVHKRKNNSKNWILQKIKEMKLVLWTLAGLVVVGLVGIVDYLSPYKIIIILGISITAGIAMALFIGRLNNKYINPSMFVIVCLYTYMAIQTLFPFWGDNDFVVLLSVNLAFIFKIVFYLFILWLFRSGKLLFYFVKVRALYESVEGHWDSFKDNVPFKKTTVNESNDD